MVEALEIIEGNGHILFQSNVPEFATKDAGRTKKSSARSSQCSG